MLVNDHDRDTQMTAEAEISEPAGNRDDGLPDFLARARQASEQSRHYVGSALRSAWQRSYKAYRNEHFEGSKYLQDAYKGRSKLFRPKTRVAVKKGDASAAQALFSTQEAVSIQPQHDDDLLSVAAAKFMHELINYRLDRSSGINGIPWFQIAIGARQDSQITGVCVAKVFWEYEEQETGEFEEGPEMVEDVTDDGDAILRPEQVPITKVGRDRPMIDLLPPEAALLDPASNWINPVQEGAYFIARYPMHVDAVRAMMATSSDRMGGGPWRSLPDEVLKKARTDWDSKTIRYSREGTQDRFTDNTNTIGAYDILWVHENFFRHGGVDYHFWSVGVSDYLTDPTPVEEVYPGHKGMRPYVLGVASLEPHKVWPMSPVEAVQPLQQEANDLVNLRLDNIKQNISPITKVKRGKRVDYKQLRNRGPDQTILLDDPDDVIFDRAPDVAGSAYTEMNHLNSDFDELAGSFSQGSVMTNRSLNETVGGMKMLSGSANALTEFDSRIWVETFVEPVLRMLVMMEQYYEDDPAVLALAGKRAGIFQEEGAQEMLAELFDKELLVTVNVGVGAHDPQQKMEKMNGAVQMLGGVAPMFNREVKVNAEEMITEIMGFAGFKDGLRFFEIADPEAAQEDQGPPPEMQLEQMRQQHEKEIAQLEWQSRAMIEKMKADTSVLKEGLTHDANIERGEMVEKAAAMRMAADIMNKKQTKAAELLAAERRQQQTAVPTI